METVCQSTSRGKTCLGSDMNSDELRQFLPSVKKPLLRKCDAPEDLETVSLPASRIKAENQKSIKSRDRKVELTCARYDVW